MITKTMVDAAVAKCIELGFDRPPTDDVIREILEVAEIAGWQPIETAPKDYTVILLSQPESPGYAEAVGQGHRTDLHPDAHDKWVLQATGWRAEPTHWRPLPPPPTANGKS